MKQHLLVVLVLIVMQAPSVGPTTVFADALFAGKADFATGDCPHSVAIGDLNGDGKPDLAVANWNDNTVSVLPGNGNGTFGTKTDFATVGFPQPVAIGDLNGDGKPDLAVANVNVNTVSVLLGNGNGTFGTKTDFATGYIPHSVAIGDLNGDGKPDLAVANFDWDVSVLLGNGNGTFGTKTDFATGSHPQSVAIGDLDLDGNPDLAVANLSDNTVSVLLGNGDGNFGTKTDFATGSEPMSVAIGDLNGDGKPDLAVANFSDDMVSVLLNTHADQGPITTFAPATEFYADRTNLEFVALFNDPRPESQTVASAEYIIDTPDAVGPGSGTAIVLDGATPYATGRFSVQRASLTSGHHVIYVRGRNSAGRWGPLAQTDVTLHDTGFDPVTDGFAFTNTGLPRSQPDISFEYLGNVLWANMHLDGVCTGMSRVAAEYKLKAVSQLPCNSTAFPDPASGDECSRVYWDIINAQDDPLYQVPGGVLPMRIMQACGGMSSTDVQKVYTSVLASCASRPATQYQPIFMQAFLPGGSGHCVLAYAAVDFGLTKVILVYDSNAGNRDGGAITLLSNEGVWSVWAPLYSSMPLLLPAPPVKTDRVGNAITAMCPVDLHVLTPSGRQVEWGTPPSDSIVYVRAVATGDADTTENVIIAKPEVGLYHIGLTPKPSSDPNAVYSIVWSGPSGDSTWLARDVCVSDAPVDGYDLDMSTPVLLSLVSADVTAAGVKLVWFRGGSGSDVATVYRSFVGGEWTRIGETSVDGTGYLRYTDPIDATATRVGYRLGIVEAGIEGFYGETWVDLPAGNATLTFALDPVHPNPSRGGALTVHFSLPTDAPARLELLDVAGRRIASHVVGMDQHTLDLGQGQHLAPGLYLVRLTQGTNTRTTRVAVIN
jgi:hypothetical protein